MSDSPLLSEKKKTWIIELFLFKSIAKFIIKSTYYFTFMMQSLHTVYCMTVHHKPQINQKDEWALVSGYCLRDGNKKQSFPTLRYDTASTSWHRFSHQIICQIFSVLLSSGHMMAAYFLAPLRLNRAMWLIQANKLWAEMTCHFWTEFFTHQCEILLILLSLWRNNRQDLILWLLHQPESLWDFNEQNTSRGRKKKTLLFCALGFWECFSTAA